MLAKKKRENLLQPLEDRYTALPPLLDLPQAIVSASPEQYLVPPAPQK